mgnify:CR=1 FL=1
MHFSSQSDDLIQFVKISLLISSLFWRLFILLCIGSCIKKVDRKIRHINVRIAYDKNDLSAIANAIDISNSIVMNGITNLEIFITYDI